MPRSKRFVSIRNIFSLKREQGFVPCRELVLQCQPAIDFSFSGSGAFSESGALSVSAPARHRTRGVVGFLLPSTKGDETPTPPSLSLLEGLLLRCLSFKSLYSFL